MVPAQKHERLTFQKDPLVQEWIASVNPNTGQTYVLSLLYYCVFLGKTSLQLLTEEAAVQQRQRRNPLALNHGMGARQRLQEFARWLQEDHPEHILVTRIGAGRQHGTHRVERPFQKQTKRTIFKIVAAVRSFYAFKNLVFPRLRLFRRLGKPFVGATTTADIAKALHRAEGLRTKALIFVAATTGRSPSDLLKLRVGDIDRTRFPGWGFVYDPEQTRQKTGVEQISWLTPEALEHVDRYLSTRPGTNPSSYLFTESQNDREQQLNPASARRSLQRLAQFVFTNKRENPINFRNLRAWFGTQLDRNPGGYPHKQILLSHVPPYDGAYSRPTIEQLFEDVKFLYDQGYTRILAGPEEYQLKSLETRLRDESDKRLAQQEEALRQEFREHMASYVESGQKADEQLKETLQAVLDREKPIQDLFKTLVHIAQEWKDPKLLKFVAEVASRRGDDTAWLKRIFEDKTPEEAVRLFTENLPETERVLAYQLAETEFLAEHEAEVKKKAEEKVAQVRKEREEVLREQTKPERKPKKVK